MLHLEGHHQLVGCQTREPAFLGNGVGKHRDSMRLRICHSTAARHVAHYSLRGCSIRVPGGKGFEYRGGDVKPLQLCTSLTTACVVAASGIPRGRVSGMGKISRFSAPIPHNSLQDCPIRVALSGFPNRVRKVWLRVSRARGCGVGPNLSQQPACTGARVGLHGVQERHKWSTRQTGHDHTIYAFLLAYGTTG